MHVVEVDQSIKIEQSGPTVLAFSNGISHAVIIPATVKLEVLAVLKERGKPKYVARNLLFSAGLYLLLRDFLGKFVEIVIDEEYTGHDRYIRSYLLEYIKRDGLSFEAERIVFKRIGKDSPADRKARAVRRKNDKLYRTVTLEEVLRIIQ